MPGLDNKILNNLDFNKSLKRIVKDINSDFIFAPHLNFIYQSASQELVDNLKQKLNSGVFEFGQPVTINVPKKTKLTRPGSILLPLDRLLYQVIVDHLSEDIEKMYP
ncbi:MAG: hypothetical protein KBA66_03025 [Leptospiraceae bacterium]|nr:hypothetical protein [Leptospiraceae bacterium]